MTKMRIYPRSSGRSNGFTLIELMVVIALIAIITTMAVPSWQRMIVSNRIRASVNDLTLSIQFARSETLRQNGPVTVCPSSEGVNCTASGYEAGWMVKTGLPAVAATDRILQDTLPKQRLTMVADATTVAAGGLTFLPSGALIGTFPQGVRIAVKDDPATDTTLERYICIARTGRVRVLTRDLYVVLLPGECGPP